MISIDKRIRLLDNPGCWPMARIMSGSALDKPETKANYWSAVRGNANSQTDMQTLSQFISNETLADGS